MKKLLFIFLMVITFCLKAQVGINTTNPYSLLDITATNINTPSDIDGALIPRINNLPITNPGANQHSMLIYLNNDLVNINISGVAQDYQRGFYYWDNTLNNWVQLNFSNRNWGITGNDNTVSGINFLGTTTSEEVDFRVNNKLVTRLTELGQFELEADEQSIFIGFEAGESYDPAGSAAQKNVYIGYEAGTNSSSGRENVAIGALSFRRNDSGNFNTALGSETLWNNNNGDNNTAIGNDALRENDSGSRNTAVGSNALLNNNNSNNNTAIGNLSLRDNESGSNNTAIGKNSLLINNSGNNNVAIGFNALNNAVNGDNNIAVGVNTGISTSNVRNGIIVGFNASIDSESNTNSLVMGTNATIDGNQNVNTIVIGNTASIVGSDNRGSVVIGNAAISNGQNGRNSIVIGTNANNIGAASSIAIGLNSVAENINSTISNGIALGTGSTVQRPNSIAIGSNASIISVNGRNARHTIAMGTNANSTWLNSIALGANSSTTQANQLRLGSINQFDLNGANIVNASDIRFKYEVEENVPGLDFITRLRPVTYKFDYNKLDIFNNEKLIRNNTAVTETGLMAQEIEAAMLATGYDFDGLVKPEDTTTDIYKVSYIKFVVPLIQAVQEQQVLIKNEQEKNKALEDRLNRLEQLLLAQEK